ncbi:MAG: acyl-CoA dehydrogenase family protein [Deltaproteobacteria bacterium]|nr:acyl-CoA dehydrogenase family protein [Deltaproteobacteria bacterium]
MAQDTITQKEKEAAKEVMEIAEAAREEKWVHPSFVGELFMGRLRTDLIAPYPQQTAEDKKIGDEYLKKVEEFLKKNVDPELHDRTGEIPQAVIKGLIELGCFGMKIPKEYGGLGLSQVNYNRVVQLVTSYCGSVAVWLSAHQSIGVPQPLKLFGTPEQKKKFLPRLVKEISAFALTEPGVGSDPAQMATTATPTEDGKYFTLNGEKLWCTNGPVASLIIVMAKTPSKFVNGKEKKQITAFIVEANSPGIEVVHRCQFMGLRAIQNGLIRFKNVKVPRENILWGEGLGLKLALITLNTGRLTLPAACVGAAKLALEISKKWSNERVQWGAPIGKHEAIASKIGEMSATLFAMEAITWLTSTYVDLGGRDIRLEAAMCKLFCSEKGWKIIDETLQIRGGRGYETAESLRQRGEEGVPIERMMRDFRINTLIEGSSEILRLFIAREALDPHMRVAGALINPKSPFSAKMKAIGKMGTFYSRWYPQQWLHWSLWPKHASFGPLARHARFVDHASHRLARTIFHCMSVHQARLERRQQVLGRIVDIGTDLFAMAASCSRAITLSKQNNADRTPLQLADLFCRIAKRRIKRAFKEIWSNEDAKTYSVARGLLEGQMGWLTTGIIKETSSTGPVTEVSKPRLAQVR